MTFFILYSNSHATQQKLNTKSLYSYLSRQYNSASNHRQLIYAKKSGQRS